MISLKSIAVALLALSTYSYGHLAPFYETQTLHGRSGIVQMLEWKWLDIANECEQFLGPKGYAAVQLSPPTENLVLKQEDGNRPWYERYQVMSYKLETRSGNEAEFAEMTRRCNAVGVRIYVDTVINHMTADLEDAVGTGGSFADTVAMFYPGAEFNRSHFHVPHCSINNFNDPIEMRVCELVGLHDLNQSHPFVREKIIDYMNHLVDLGVGGFRVDAAKHMWPKELKMMLEAVKPLNTEYGFAPNSKPFVYQEVIDFDGQGITYEEYSHIGRIIDFRTSKHLSRAFNGEVSLNHLNSWGEGWDLVFGEVAVAFIDNHDNQRHDNGYGEILTFKRPKPYKMANAFMLAFPHAFPKVMSSFDFNTTQQGPPANEKGEILSPELNSEGQCINGFICEHRWRPIAGMIGFRNAAEMTAVHHWWDNGANQIAFSRGDKAFIAFNNENNILSQTLQTGLPEGTYCDVITGDVMPAERHCSGKEIIVDSTGKANITILPDDANGFLAIHIRAKLLG